MYLYTLQYKVISDEKSMQEFVMRKTIRPPTAAITRPLDVKFILPALTEATSPYWRPIKYSLFPPLGLAMLAAFLREDDRAVIADEHVRKLEVNDEPDLVVIQVYITNA